MADLNDSLQETSDATGGQSASLFGHADMDTTQIVSGLQRLFTKERHRIVFWNDPDCEFTQVVGTLKLDAVTIVRW